MRLYSTYTFLLFLRQPFSNSIGPWTLEQNATLCKFDLPRTTVVLCFRSVRIPLHAEVPTAHRDNDSLEPGWSSVSHIPFFFENYSDFGRLTPGVFFLAVALEVGPFSLLVGFRLAAFNNGIRVSHKKIVVSVRSARERTVSEGASTTAPRHIGGVETWTTNAARSSHKFFIAVKNRFASFANRHLGHLVSVWWFSFQFSISIDFNFKIYFSFQFCSSVQCLGRLGRFVNFLTIYIETNEIRSFVVVSCVGIEIYTAAATQERTTRRALPCSFRKKISRQSFKGGRTSTRSAMFENIRRWVYHFCYIHEPLAQVKQRRNSVTWTLKP